MPRTKPQTKTQYVEQDAEQYMAENPPEPEQVPFGAEHVEDEEVGEVYEGCDTELMNSDHENNVDPHVQIIERVIGGRVIQITLELGRN